MYIDFLRSVPAKTTRSPNVGIMLAHCLRRWANIMPILSQRVSFTECHSFIQSDVFI